MFRATAIAVCLFCPSLAAQDSGNMILAAGRSGVVELISPATLETAARIQLDFGPQSVGLNGISASADGSTLYVEGPLSSDPSGCCELYSVDLATLQAKLAASVPGSRSRNQFVVSGSLVYAAKALIPSGIPQDAAADRFHLSPNGGWLFGVKRFRGPALDVFDVARGQVVRQLTPDEMAGDWWPAGVWSGDGFHLYVSNGKGEGRLWTVSGETEKLGAGVQVAPIGKIPGCSGYSSIAMAAAAGTVFLYEQFGFKVDRRNGCPGQIPGGAWAVDTATGQLTRQIAPEVHFSVLLSDPSGHELYGLSAGGPTWDFPRIVRIDPRDGRILQSRYLAPGFWRIAIAPLRSVPLF